MENDLNKLNNEYKKLQKEETKNVFYGEHDIISRPGFDSISSFDEEIKNVRNLIKDYDELLLENQSKLKNIVNSLDTFNEHHEIALPNQTEFLNNQYVSFLDKQKKYLEMKDKEKKNLDELLEAKKEFVRETRFVYKNQAKDKVSLLKEYDAKQKELKVLEYKISNGMANEIEKSRYDVLKNEIIPEIEMKLGNNKTNQNGNTNQINLDELASKMSIDEMNTILNMTAAEKKDPEILEDIAKRLGVPVDKLKEIASKKEEILKAKENDATSSSDNSSSNESEDKDNNKEKSETAPSSDSSSSETTETGAEAIESEERKKPKALKTAGEKLKNAIAKHKGKALAALLGIAGLAALVLINPTMLLYALGAAGLGKIYKDFQAGAKGK